MAAIRIIDDHLELANIGSNTHAQIDTHIAAADDYVKRDGSLALTSDWDIGDTRKLLADEIRARDAAGLKLYDDGSKGIFVEDGGNVGIGTNTPASELDIIGGVKIQSALTPDSTHILTAGNANDHTYIQLGQASTHNYEMGWRYNATPANAYGQIVTFGYANDLRINSKNLILQDASGGKVGINITWPTAKLDVNSDIIRLRTAKTPATAGAAGNTGDMGADADYIYRCVSTNSWKRAALNVW